MNSDVKDQPWEGDPLPRGRHKLPREAVRASQRERLLRAMAELVGEKGYSATSVSQIIASARVSTNTFYGFFADKTDCFIALCEQQGDELLAAIVAGRTNATEAAGALTGFDNGLQTYLNWWPERPALARAYFVELPMAGPRAIAERDRQYERFGELLRYTATRARELRPETLPLREVDLKAAVILMRELVAEEVRAGRVASIPHLEVDLRYMLLKLLVDDDAARRAAPAGPRDS